MQRNKDALRLQQVLDIKAGKPMPRTTEKSAFNQATEANRPKNTRCYIRPRGRMLTQLEMGILRRWSQIWGTTDLQTDADMLRGFKVK